MKHLHVVKVEKSHALKPMRNMEKEVNVHYIHIHMHIFYKQPGFIAGGFPESEAACQNCLACRYFPICLPSSLINSLIH
jgi:dTDP-4-amino-4,6-dideoxygalactose transaminase